jgi:hypothetical protein
MPVAWMKQLPRQSTDDFLTAIQQAAQKLNAPEEHVKRVASALETARQAAIDSTHESQARNKRYYDVGTKTPTYAPGDRIWVFNSVVPRGQKPKLYRKYTGPFYITLR